MQIRTDTTDDQINKLPIGVWTEKKTFNPKPFRWATAACNTRVGNKLKSFFLKRWMNANKRLPSEIQNKESEFAS